MGRGDVWDGDAGTSNTGTWGTQDVNDYWLCIKVGRGEGNGDIGTRVWGLGTWGLVERDVGTSSMGRGDVWDGDAGTSNIGTRGTWGR